MKWFDQLLDRLTALFWVEIEQEELNFIPEPSVWTRENIAGWSTRASITRTALNTGLRCRAWRGGLQVALRENKVLRAEVDALRKSSALRAEEASTSLLKMWGLG